MFSKVVDVMKEFLSLSKQDNLKTDFLIGVYKINLTWGKIIAIAFIILEVMQLVASYIIKRDGFLKKPDIYYGAMYILMLLVMIVYLLIFVKLGNNIPEHGRNIRVAGVSFISIILLWCAGISLLDQFSSGQVIVYIAAIVSIALFPFFRPVDLLFVYLTIHVLFLVLMPYFQKSSGILFGNYTNSTTILIISWAISNMRFKKQVEDFNNRKIIQEKSNELKRVNIELKEANQKLERLSQTDSLTGIFNRLVFDRSIKAEWDRCKRHSISLSLILADIDFFKEFNDNYGHQAGDDCLRRVTEVLSNCVKRSSDIVARYGGEEFAVILPYMNQKNALDLAEQMRKKVEDLNIPHQYSLACKYLTISLGVHSVIPSDELVIENFIKVTDNALFKAKKENRNNVVVI